MCRHQEEDLGDITLNDVKQPYKCHQGGACKKEVRGHIIVDKVKGGCLGYVLALIMYFRNRGVCIQFIFTVKMQFFGGTDMAAATSSGNRMRYMYIFNRNGVCLYYRDWLRPLTTLSPQQDHKLMFGLLFSLKSFTAKMDPIRYALCFLIKI
eukprot:Gb_33295 [translate_table: standard]